MAADLALRLGERSAIGAGVVAALAREDTDFNDFPFRRVNPGDFADGRLYGEWRISSEVALRGRLENLFNQRYEEVYGFPALGRRASLSLAVRR
jgi:outer membrane cobalamin receptor